jgi:hypothetical protein
MTYQMQELFSTDIKLVRGQILNIEAELRRNIVSTFKDCLFSLNLQLKKGLADQLPEVKLMHLTELLAVSLAG